MQKETLKTWEKIIEPLTQSANYRQAIATVKKERREGHKIHPSTSQILGAFKLTPMHKCKVVIIGQDPYHGPGQAHGLAFSVPKTIKVPPSLRNIFKELRRDVNKEMPAHGNLSSWAKQGVLLLNTILTVREGEPLSHQNIGWTDFSNSVIDQISCTCPHIVFMLWGKQAQQKIPWIHYRKRHLILCSSHPSPLSASRGFNECGHFSECNRFLMKKGLTAIKW